MTRVSQIETAYDVLLMASMKRRLGGDVANSVRFADVAKAKPKAQVWPFDIDFLKVLYFNGLGIEHQSGCHQ